MVWLLLFILVCVCWLASKEEGTKGTYEKKSAEEIQYEKRRTEHRERMKAAEETLNSFNIIKAKESVKREAFKTDEEYEKAVSVFACLETKKGLRKEDSQKIEMLQFKLRWIYQDENFKEMAIEARNRFGNSWYKQWVEVYNENVDYWELIEYAMVYELVFGEASLKDV